MKLVDFAFECDLELVGGVRNPRLLRLYRMAESVSLRLPTSRADAIGTEDFSKMVVIVVGEASAFTGLDVVLGVAEISVLRPHFVVDFGVSDQRAELAMVDVACAGVDVAAGGDAKFAKHADLLKHLIVTSRGEHVVELQRSWHRSRKGYVALSLVVSPNGVRLDAVVNRKMEGVEVSRRRVATYEVVAEALLDVDAWGGVAWDGDRVVVSGSGRKKLASWVVRWD